MRCALLFFNSEYDNFAESTTLHKMPDDIIRLDTIEQYNRLLGAETLHPLVSMTDLSRLKSIKHCRKEFGFYCIYYKELECGTIEYGRSKYDYQEGTLLFISPGQVGGVNDGGEVCLSPNYFGDLIKKELGRTAQEYIRHYVIDRAKELIAENEMNVSEIAYELGFKYPHHLTRVFKKVTGITPNEFRLTVN